MKDHLQHIKVLHESLKKRRDYFKQNFPKKSLNQIHLKSFEKIHQIQLPKGYREFLLTFGDEAILPYVIGKKALSLKDTVKNEIWKSFEGPLKKPFKYNGNKPIAMDWAEEKDDYVDLRPLRGTLCLGSGGCDIIWLLVINGKEAGKVWQFIPGAEQELNPTRLTFLNWCIKGLKKVLMELDSSKK